MRKFLSWNALLIVAAASLNQACVSAPERQSAVPASLTAKAEIPGMPEVRYVAGGDMTGYLQFAVDGTAPRAGLPREPGPSGPAAARLSTWRSPAAATTARSPPGC